MNGAVSAGGVVVVVVVVRQALLFGCLQQEQLPERVWIGEIECVVEETSRDFTFNFGHNSGRPIVVIVVVRIPTLLVTWTSGQRRYFGALDVAHGIGVVLKARSLSLSSSLIKGMCRFTRSFQVRLQ